MAAKKKTQPKLSPAVLALTSVGSARAAEQLARGLLAARVCACVSIVPQARSLYWWRGKVRDEAELLLLIKTVRGRLAALRRKLAQLHPYEVPELLVLDPDAVGAYAQWLSAETSGTWR